MPLDPTTWSTADWRHAAAIVAAIQLAIVAGYLAGVIAFYRRTRPAGARVAAWARDMITNRNSKESNNV